MPSSHLRKVFDPEKVKKIAAETERLRIEYGADIVCVRGLSGTLAASAMNTLFGTPFAVVRKPDEKSHGRPVEFVDEWDVDVRSYDHWIIVDDLIASGRTVREIRQAIGGYTPCSIRGRCQAIVLYHESGYDNRTEFDLGDGYIVPVIYIEDKV